ncbi:hypothetical protein NDU88_001743 [Pleurodeles waltl]|uniref:Uncharacterized protein n=1 Tax=Pleurodeles waltl TaxID=8319 RepID=A0AAV7T021_PLEWA|nr:hypothetical protein NDU88_001743 [Pleurodeles waltl]
MEQAPVIGGTQDAFSPPSEQGERITPWRPAARREAMASRICEAQSRRSASPLRGHRGRREPGCLPTHPCFPPHSELEEPPPRGRNSGSWAAHGGGDSALDPTPTRPGTVTHGGLPVDPRCVTTSG